MCLLLELWLHMCELLLLCLQALAGLKRLYAARAVRWLTRCILLALVSLNMR